MVGIFGGTFDPIHYGHLRPALDIAQQLELEEVRFIPSYVPPHRENPATSVDVRVAMVKAAISEEPRFALDLREVEREGRSYMVDTLTSLKADFPQQTLCLMVGMDAFLGLHSWHRWQELVELCHVVVSQRPGYQLSESQLAPELQPYYQQQLVENNDELAKSSGGKLTFCEVTQLEISATQIRNLCQQGHSLHYLVPDKVRDLVEYHQLYRN